ncbi:MAG: ribosomal protein L7/L12 [Deltaproteobacteria bacterium]|nr:ribosomal protein L7/L12 [Deltaproteobacteria bacterium]
MRNNLKAWGIVGVLVVLVACSSEQGVNSPDPNLNNQPPAIQGGPSNIAGPTPSASPSPSPSPAVRAEVEKHDVILRSMSNKNAAIRVIRELFNYGLREAVYMADNIPVRLAECVSQEEVQTLQDKFKDENGYFATLDSVACGEGAPFVRIPPEAPANNVGGEIAPPIDPRWERQNSSVVLNGYDPNFRDKLISKLSEMMELTLREAIGLVDDLRDVRLVVVSCVTAHKAETTARDLEKVGGEVQIVEGNCGADWTVFLLGFQAAREEPLIERLVEMTGRDPRELRRRIRGINEDAPFTVLECVNQNQSRLALNLLAHAGGNTRSNRPPNGCAQ